MKTAAEIAAHYVGETSEILNLELDILRHMERHVIAEREVCAKIVENLMSEDRSTLYDIGALQTLADLIRNRNK